MTTDKEPGNLSGSYALNALDAAEQKAFEQHLATSDQTRDEVTELSDTAVLLGLAVDPVTPSAGLKQSIMDQLDAYPQLARDGSPAASTPATLKAQVRWFQRPALVLTSSAAAIALILGGGIVGSAIGENQFRVAQETTMAAISDAPDSQQASVPVAGGGSATLVWSGELASAGLVVDGLDPQPVGHVYQLWYINDDGARPAGTFTVDASGSTWRVLTGAMASGDTVGVTVEPRGGSPVPTTDPIALIASA